MSLVPKSCADLFGDLQRASVRIALHLLGFDSFTHCNGDMASFSLFFFCLFVHLER